MDQGNAEKSEQGQKSMQELQRQAFIEAIRQIEASDNSPEQKAEQKEALTKEALNLFRKNAETVKKYQEQEIKGEELTDEQKKEAKDAKENLQKALIQVTTAADKDIQVVEDKKAQGVLRELAKKDISETTAVSIQKHLDQWLLGENPKEIVVGKPDEKSDFDKAVEGLKAENEEAHKSVVEALKKRASDFGLKTEQITEKYEPQPSQEELMRKQSEQQEPDYQSRREFENIGIFEKFTQKQMNFIKLLHDPENFVSYINEELNGEGPNTVSKKQEIEEEKKEISDRLRKHFDKRNLTVDEDKLKIATEKMWKEEVSGKIESRLMDVMNHLYLQLQQERPDKFFEDITREDFMRGITTTQQAITAAIRKLAVILGEAERDRDNPLHDLAVNTKLIRNAEEDYYTEQRRKLHEGELIERHYPVLKPLPYGKEVSLSEFVEYMNVGIINHWTHAMEYFHNTRVMHNHPPGEKGFYSQLGGYAEHLKGTDIDELLLLPDGQTILQAYHLYDKLLEEELAQQDWKVRAYQFSNKLEKTSTQLESEVMERLRLLYPNKSDEQLINAVNTAVGIARGMLLTEPEKNAYSDPVDPEGGGFFASYATNDAGSLTVFNPLHVNLRWQGEHMLPIFYFMDVEGSGSTWDHRKAWNNAKLFMESVKTGKRDGRLPKKLFIDQLVDIMNVGGPAKRRGWRMLHSLENHYEYFKNKTVDKDGNPVVEDLLDPLESFKAMETIGYEAMFNFIEQRRAGTHILNAKEGTMLATKRNQWFEYLYRRYFYEGEAKNCPPGEFDNYMKQLKELGREKALEHVKKKGSYAAGTEEAQIEAETSQLFLDRFIVREIAARFPSKFLRMDRNRYHRDGLSRWKSIQVDFEKERKWDIEKFDDVMKDLSFAEMLLRQEMSKIIRERVKLEPGIGLNKFDDIDYKLSSEKIKKLFSHLKDKNGRHVMSDQRIKDVVDLYEAINQKIINGKNKDTGKRYLDGECLEDVKAYSFTFGVEDTDISLMAWRATGPRMTARAIKDTGSFESDVIPWIIDAPKLLNQIAISGKHDFSPIIEYLRKAQLAIQKVHGTKPDHEFVYKMASMVIQYFKKDTNAKGLLSIFQLASKQPHSIAGEYAGRSSAVWEWDARDIDRFIIALESNSLLPRLPYSKQDGPSYEDRYITIFGRQIKLGQKIKEDYPHNSGKLRGKFGADWKAIALEAINSILPIALAYMMWQYISKATEEAEGKKKQ